MGSYYGEYGNLELINYKIILLKFEFNRIRLIADRVVPVKFIFIFISSAIPTLVQINRIYNDNRMFVILILLEKENFRSNTGSSSVYSTDNNDKQTTAHSATH